MAYIGLLCLGIFVGSVAVLGFKQAENDCAKGGTAVLGAALGGVAITFLDKYMPIGNAPDAIFMYPIGLLVSIPWFYMPEVLGMSSAQPGKDGQPAQAEHPSLTILAITGTVIITALAVALALIPAFRAMLR